MDYMIYSCDFLKPHKTHTHNRNRTLPPHSPQETPLGEGGTTLPAFTVFLNTTPGCRRHPDERCRFGLYESALPFG